MDSIEFAAREKAAAELERAGRGIINGVRQRLEKVRSAEVRERLTRFLAKHDLSAAPPDELRELRMLEVLEEIGTRDARSLLKELTEGEPTATLTRDAAATLRLLEARSQ